MPDLPPLLLAVLQPLRDDRASDLHLKVGAAPHLRVDGTLRAVAGPPLTPTDVEAVVGHLVPAGRRVRAEAEGEADFAWSVPGLGRFRVHLQRQRGTWSLVLRKVAVGLPEVSRLLIPDVVLAQADHPSGLVLVGGPAGSGRSTTMALLVDRVNASRAANIVTFEDPIEFLHPDKRALVSQREIGADTPSFADGLRRVLRADPDVIVIGDLADAETAGPAVAAAVNGRLVLATVTAASAAAALTRIVEWFPEPQRPSVRAQLGLAVRSIVVQHLVDRVDGLGRAPAMEVLIATPTVAGVIASPVTPLAEIARCVEEGVYHGMQTVDRSLADLVAAGAVHPQTALRRAERPEELRIALQRRGVSLAA
jgi:twitching motility protein PilT